LFLQKKKFQYLLLRKYYLKKKKPIRHELKIQTPSEKPEKMGFGELPPLPPEPKIGLIKGPPKKSFFQKIFKR